MNRLGFKPLKATKVIYESKKLEIYRLELDLSVLYRHFANARQ